MAGNSYGTIFKLTTFGESHGKAIGGVIDGCPAGLRVDIEKVQAELDKRKPGQNKISSQRKEGDQVEFLSGIFEGKTLGTPIGFVIYNSDAKSKDYSHLKGTFRPSHADYTYQQKYGIRDYRGGGRSSARETACRVVAGALATQFLQTKGIDTMAFVSQIGNLKITDPIENINLSAIDENIVRCPDKELAEEMEQLILDTKKQGDTLGGCITGVVKNTHVGLGEPIFDKLHAELAKAMLSINAVKGFEIGSGFAAASMKGSEHNDVFTSEKGEITTSTNYSGGIQGGISNGQHIYFRVAFKPVATIMRQQETVNNKAEKVELEGKGRHDPCVVPRAVPIVKAMTALVLADFYLRNQHAKI